MSAFARWPVEGLGRRIGLAHQDERLPQIIGRHGIARQQRLALFERGHGGGVTAALAFQKPDDDPGYAVLGIFLGSLGEFADQLVERAALDVIAIQAIESRATARIAFEHAAKALGDRPIALFLGVSLVFVVRFFGRRLWFKNLFWRLGEGISGCPNERKEKKRPPESSVPH